MEPVALSRSVEIDFLVALNQFLRAIEKEAVSLLVPAIAAEIEAVRFRAGDKRAGGVRTRDDAGDNARSILAYLRSQSINAQAQATIKALATIKAESARHTKRWTAAVSSGTNVDVSALLGDDDLVDLISIRSGEMNALIRNMSDDVLNRIERRTLGSIFEGKGNREVEAELRTEFGMSRNRARLIARDQASKLNGAMNQFRQEQAGVTHYTWRTVLDGRERDTHRARNGKIFPWAKPPSDGHPGRAINCRCRASAVLIDDPDDIPPDLGEPEPQDVPAGLDLVSRVAEMSRSNLFELSRQALVIQRAEVQAAQQFAAGLKATNASTDDLESVFVALFGFPSEGQDLAKMAGIGLAKSLVTSRRAALIAAIQSRLDVIDDVLIHAAETSPN